MEDKTDKDVIDLMREAEPSEEEVIRKLNNCYQAINYVLREYVDLKEEYYSIISLWIIGTYVHDSFNTFPFLFINAMRGSGKTRLLKLIAALSKDGDIQANISESVLFRTAKGRTILLDEMESIGSKERGLLRELLNAGYKKGIKVKRMHKGKNDEGEEEWQVDEFDLYTPIAIANINGIDDVLSDRCIHLILEKSTKNHISKLIEDFDDSTLIKEIKANLTHIQCRVCNVVLKKNIIKGWNNYIKQGYLQSPTHPTYITHSTLSTLSTYIPTVEEEMIYEKIDGLGIDSRNLELFFPLFVIARVLDNETFEDILATAKEMVEKKKGDEVAESPDVMLYSFLAFSSPLDWRSNYISMNELTRKFKEHISEDREDINAIWMGKALKRLNILIDKKRKTKGIEVMINFEKAREKMFIFSPKWNGKCRRKEAIPVIEDKRKSPHSYSKDFFPTAEDSGSGE